MSCRPRLVAERLRLFGAHVIGLRASTRPCDQVDEQITFDDIDQALGCADFVCIHVPKTAETENLVDARFLSRMKPTARLVNTSRGAQVDEAALIDAIERGTIAGAYLDMFREEPLPANSPLWERRRTYKKSNRRRLTTPKPRRVKTSKICS